jgi:hypothetical protein
MNNGLNGQYLVLMGIFYLITITVETAVLVVALSPRHPIRTKIFAGIWLTACTYPIVWLVFPRLINPAADRALYLTVAETFAPAAECLLFWLAFDKPLRRLAQGEQVQSPVMRDMVAIVIANLASFGAGIVLEQVGIAGQMMDWVQRPGGLFDKLFG